MNQSCGGKSSRQSKTRRCSRHLASIQNSIPSPGQMAPIFLQNSCISPFLHNAAVSHLNRAEVDKGTNNGTLRTCQWIGPFLFISLNSIRGRIWVERTASQSVRISRRCNSDGLWGCHWRGRWEMISGSYGQTCHSVLPGHSSPFTKKELFCCMVLSRSHRKHRQTNCLRLSVD